METERNLRAAIRKAQSLTARMAEMSEDGQSLHVVRDEIENAVRLVEHEMRGDYA
jgi:hypothetical protein